MTKNLITFILVLIGVLGIFLFARGITGFVTYDDAVGEICFFDFPCNSPNVCCPFFNEEDKGVCHNPDMCEIIWELTKSEMVSDEELRLLIYSNHDLSYNDKSSTIVLGGLIFVLVIFALYINYKSHHHTHKKKKHIS